MIRSAPGEPIASALPSVCRPTVGAMFDGSRVPGGQPCRPSPVELGLAEAVVEPHARPGRHHAGAVPRRRGDRAGQPVTVDGRDVCCRRRRCATRRGPACADLVQQRARPRRPGRPRCRAGGLRSPSTAAMITASRARSSAVQRCTGRSSRSRSIAPSTVPPIAGGGFVERCHPRRSTASDCPDDRRRTRQDRRLRADHRSRPCRRPSPGRGRRGRRRLRPSRAISSSDSARSATRTRSPATSGVPSGWWTAAWLAGSAPKINSCTSARYDAAARPSGDPIRAASTAGSTTAAHGARPYRRCARSSAASAPGVATEPWPDGRGEPAAVRGGDLADAAAEPLARRRATGHLDVAVDRHRLGTRRADGDERAAAERHDTRLGHHRDQRRRDRGVDRGAAGLGEGGRRCGRDDVRRRDAEPRSVP